MTAFVTGPLSESDSERTAGTGADALLRFALRADATLCAAVGLFVAMGTDVLARLAGLSATTGWIVGNGLCSVAAVTAIVAGWLPLTVAGAELLSGFVATTMGLAWLQYRGVRRLVTPYRAGAGARQSISAGRGCGWGRPHRA